MAHRSGAGCLAIWPGQEWFDYTFQVDHVAVWERCLASLRTIAEGVGDLRVAVEYKLKEPRQKSVFGTAAQTLAAVHEIGRANLGVLLDFGHSLMGKESPAQTAALLLRSRQRPEALTESLSRELYVLFCSLIPPFTSI